MPPALRSTCFAMKWKPIAYRSRNARPPSDIASRIRLRAASCSVTKTIVNSRFMRSSRTLVLAHGGEKAVLEGPACRAHLVEARAARHEPARDLRQHGFTRDRETHDVAIAPDVAAERFELASAGLVEA